MTSVNGLAVYKTNAGPRENEKWIERLKEEYVGLIDLLKAAKESGTEWFKLDPSLDGIKWKGTCWYVHELKKYEYPFEFEIPVSYPKTPPEILIPSLDGKTAKMYRGGAICMTQHFYPLWSENAPKFGIAHALTLGLAPWLAVEIPDLVAKKII